MVELEKLKFDENGLIPVVAKDIYSGEVRMVAYASKEAVKKAMQTGQGWYFSRSRNRLWKKGEESGNTQRLRAIYTDCDRDCLLYLVEQKGPACHKGTPTCFEKKLWGDGTQAELLSGIYTVIESRRENKPPGSYVAGIIGSRTKISSKIKEESKELIEALNEKSNDDVVHEAADNIFFTMLALASRRIKWKKLLKELEKRRNK